MMWVHWKLGLKVLWMAQNQLGFLRKGVAERIWLYWDHYFDSIPMWHRWFCTKKLDMIFIFLIVFSASTRYWQQIQFKWINSETEKNLYCLWTWQDERKRVLKIENSDWDALFLLIQKLFVENTTICLKFLSITL